MQGELISIGNELLNGQTINTNAAWLAKELTLLGIPLTQVTTIADSREKILNALKDAGLHADIIIITGGLGPTKDDITKEAIYEYFSTSPVFDRQVFEDIKTHFSSRGIPPPPLNKSQAEVPESARVFPNSHGTAPGMWLEKDSRVYIFLPGVPYEMQHLMREAVLPAIAQTFPLPHIIYRTVLTQGISESELAEIIEAWEDSLKEKNIQLAYLPSPGIVKLRLFSTGENKAAILKSINQKIEELQQLIPQYIFGFDNDTLEELLGGLLKAKKMNLATAESCSGGYLAHLITRVAGSSEYFSGAIIAYSNEVKINMLGVSKTTLQQHGAVSKQVVEQMAAGVKKALNTDCAISTSGIAGPTGGTQEKPVGTVWIAIATPQKVISKKFSFGNDRGRNIHKSALMGLDMLRRALLEE